MLIQRVEVGETEDKKVFEAVLLRDQSCLIRWGKLDWTTINRLPVHDIKTLNILEEMYLEFIKQTRVLH